MIYSRPVLVNGRQLDRLWYCCGSCYSNDLLDEPANDRLGKGGPETDSKPSEYPQACSQCQAPVGNPLTEKGMERVREWVREGEPEAERFARAYGIEV